MHKRRAHVLMHKRRAHVRFRMRGCSNGARGANGELSGSSSSRGGVGAAISSMNPVLWHTVVCPWSAELPRVLLHVVGMNERVVDFGRRSAGRCHVPAGVRVASGCG